MYSTNKATLTLPMSVTGAMSRYMVSADGAELLGLQKHIPSNRSAFFIGDSVQSGTILSKCYPSLFMARSLVCICPPPPPPLPPIRTTFAMSSGQSWEVIVVHYIYCIRSTELTSVVLALRRGSLHCIER